MDERGSAQAINEEATRWVARIDSRALDSGDKADLKRWLVRDDRHRGALFRALAVWETLGHETALEPEIWDAVRGEDPIKDHEAGNAEQREASDAKFGRRR